LLNKCTGIEGISDFRVSGHRF